MICVSRESALASNHPETMTTTLAKTTCCRAEVSICTDTGEPYCKSCFGPAALTLEPEPKVARLAADYTHYVYNTDITLPAGSLCHVLPCDGGEVYRFRPLTEYEILEELECGIALGLLRDGAARHGEQIEAVFPLDDETLKVEVCHPVFIDPEGELVRA